MNRYKKNSLILLFGVSILFLLIPKNALSEPNVIMTPKQIYELLDNGQYDEATIQATILKESQPDNPIAYLALGDAIAHYPNDDGDIYAAFDIWVQAKALSSAKDPNWEFAQERLAWSLERSGVLKLIPSSRKTVAGLNKNMFHKLYTTQMVDIPLRTDVMLGGMYFTNLPTGEFILEIKPVPNLPHLVQKYTISAGQLKKIVVPLTEEEVKEAITQGLFIWKETEGQSMIDSYQESQQVEEEQIPEKQNYPLPNITIPKEVRVVLQSKEGEEFEYESGKEVLEGTYSAIVMNKKKRLEGTWVLPDDIEAQSVVSLIESLNKPSRKSLKENKAKTDNKSKKEVKPTEEVKTMEDIKPIEEMKIEVLSSDKPPVENPEIEPKGKMSDDAYRNLHSSFQRAEKQLRNAIVITAGYTLMSNRLASRNAVAANAETQSQSKYETFASQSEYWERQQNTSMLIAAEIASTYVLCRTLRKSMSPKKSSNQSNQ